MSAFIVSKQHIDSLVTGWIACGVGHHHGDRSASADIVGAMLWRENHSSVNHRYRRTAEAPLYHFSRVRLPAGGIRRGIAALLKLIDCYEYQSCEHPEWAASDAAKWCDRLRGEAIRLLPGYDDAPWTADDDRALCTSEKSAPSAEVRS